MAYLEQKPHRGFCSKTLMLQVRFAHPPNPAPSSRFFVLFRSAYFPSPHRTSSSSCSGVPVGLFSEKSTPYSFLQNARPSGSLRSPSEPRTALPFLCAFLVGLFSVCAPKPSFRRFRCSAWLIQLRQRTALSPLKRSCFRFAPLTLRTPHRSPVSSPLAAAAALWLPCVRGAVRRSGLRGCPLGVRGKGKGPAGPFPNLRTEPALRAAPVFRSAY